MMAAIDQSTVKRDFLALPEWAGVAEEVVRELVDVADVVGFGSDAMLTVEHHPARYIYLLHSGSANIYKQLDEVDDQLFVGSVERTWAAVGWSGFRKPHRYATTTRCTSATITLRWPREVLHDVLTRRVELGTRFLSLVLRTSIELLVAAHNILGRTARTSVELDYADGHSRDFSFQPGQNAVLPWFEGSEFFQELEQQDLNYLAQRATIRQYPCGTCVGSANHCDRGLYMLVSGSVALYSRLSEHYPAHPERLVFLRTLSEPGRVLGWSATAVSGSDDLMAIAEQDTLVCFVSSDDIDARIDTRPAFGVAFIDRLLALVGNQLRTARAQLTSQRSGDESFTVRNVIAQAAPQLSVESELHKVPHLLGSRLTQGDAFGCLDRLKATGASLERNLAGLCIDLLRETRREWNFYRRLRRVYDVVVSAPSDCSTKEVRNRCAKAVADAFDQVRYVIDGEQHLPDEPGHIFILNHLVSHPYHALPNHFELALDTHFVSALVLSPKYGDGGVRVVRQGREAEYAHQDYYDRLGYVCVPTEESEAQRQPTGRLSNFIQTASVHLRAKSNLVICPEGTSLWSEQSPGPFKPGAFLLAGTLEPEPLIVPIAIANFDKRLRNSTLAVVIKEPFHVSERVDVRNRDALVSFLRAFRGEYRSYVEQARQLAAQG